MKIAQATWTRSSGWDREPVGGAFASGQLAFVFGGGGALADGGLLDGLRRALPRAKLFGCSTAGEICGTRVLDDSLVVTAVEFEHTTFLGRSLAVRSPGDSLAAGQALADAFPKEGLTHVLVLSDGLKVNGSALVHGLTARLPGGVSVTGGLSADGARFERTRVLWDGDAQEGIVAVLGFYGPRLKVGYASLGGWDPFGPERVITRSRGNVLYEMDGRSALDLYKRYLGEHAGGLPATGLLYPLSVRTGEEDAGVVRTILAVDEADQSMTFAGDVPEGARARLMKANFDRLIDGAAGAGAKSRGAAGAPEPDLALLISCVGRKMVLKQRVEEEVEGVREALGERTALAGFYSYGEISPFTPSARCELHNQTMTVTTFTEL